LDKSSDALEEEVFEALAKDVLEGLNVDLVSIWYFNDDHSVLTCKYSLDRNKKINLKDFKLLEKDYPHYFNAIIEMVSLKADDVYTHPGTKELIKEGEYVVRFKTPEEEVITFTDAIRGDISVSTRDIDDKILFKSDGMPTYHLANVVDDHLMEITHVIRGEEWLPSLALHQQLYNAFGWEAPKFAHLPLIMKPVGKGKLSKRDGEKMGFPVFPLTWNESIGYREEGYFPEAVTNFLALLGWNPGTEQEIFTLEELISAFSLERVNKSGARFDPDKTKWYNQHYMQTYDNTDLANAFMLNLKNKELDLPKDKNNADYIKQVVSLIKERATFVNDFWELGSYFFLAPSEYDEKAVKKQWKEDTAAIMTQLISLLEGTEDFGSENLETQVKQWISENELSFGKVMPPLRLVIVGEMKGPHIFDIMALIGKTDSINRIKTAITVL